MTPRDPRQDPRPGDSVRVPGWPVLTVEHVAYYGPVRGDYVSASGPGVRVGWVLRDWRRITAPGEVVCLAEGRFTDQDKWQP